MVYYNDLGQQGGAERFIDDVFGWIDKNTEYHVKLFVRNVSGNPFEGLRNFETFSLNQKPTQPPKTRELQKKLLDEAANWGDIIFLNDHISYHVSKLKEKITKPVISYMHRPPIDFQSDDPEEKDFQENQKKSLHDSDLVLCNSHFIESQTKSLAPNAKTEIVYPGLNTSKFTPTWKDNDFLYCHARYTRRKRQHFLIDTLAKSKHEFLMTGYVTYQPYLERIQKTITPNMKIKTNLTDEEIKNYLQTCSIFLHPAKDEPFGISPLEAMACGKIVIAHDSGGPKETLPKFGFTCKDDPDEWNDLIEELMSDPQKRKSLGKEAFEHVKSFDITNTRNGLLEVFDRYK